MKDGEKMTIVKADDFAFKFVMVCAALVFCVIVFALFKYVGFSENVQDSQEQINSYYSIEKQFEVDMSSHGYKSFDVYDTPDITNDLLSKRDGKVIVERCIGIVNDAETGYGRVLNTNSKYNFISYKNISGISENDIYITYLIYNPLNNYEDDVVERFDYKV